MSEVSYSNVPPMMAAIKSGDIEAIRSLLHAGHSPNEPQCYQVMKRRRRGNVPSPFFTEHTRLVRPVAGVSHRASF